MKILLGEEGEKKEKEKEGRRGEEEKSFVEGERKKREEMDNREC